MWRERVCAVVVGLLVTGCLSCGGPQPTGVRARAGRTCSSAIAPAPTATGVDTTMVTISGSPFGVAATRDGGWVFVATDRGLTAYAVDGHLLRQTGEVRVAGSPAGVAVTGDGRHVLVAAGHSLVVVDAERAETNAGDAVVAALESSDNDGATGVAVSRDDRFAFVTFEKTGRLAVFNLRATADGPVAGGLVGTVTLGIAPVGVAVSHDGRWLYVTSQSRAAGSATSTTGSLSVLDLSRATTDPAHAVVATVDAGCSPVRVVASFDGKTVWVSARGSNAVIAFWADKLRTDPAHAQAATIGVGAEPAGLAIVGHDRWVIVADSNRSSPTSGANLAILDIQAALDQQNALLGYAPAGAFPREIASLPNRDTVVVTNYNSQQVEVVDLAGLQ
jgi:DNA-binding beta-propeller fold protein YncE